MPSVVSECPAYWECYSSVMFGRVAKSQVLVFLRSKPHVQVRSLFTAFAFHTLLLETKVKVGVYQTQIGISLFKNEMKYIRQMTNWMGQGCQLVSPGQTGWRGHASEEDQSPADSLYWEELLDFTLVVSEYGLVRRGGRGRSPNSSNQWTLMLTRGYLWVGSRGKFLQLCVLWIL